MAPRPSITLSASQVAAIHSQQPVLGLTHAFYRYPARFSPQLASALIETFTKPGDTVLDPFCGGATTLVETAAMGRVGIGLDVSRLATFLGRVKTAPIDDRGLASIRAWSHAVGCQTLTAAPKSPSSSWQLLGYQKHLHGPRTWAIRKSLELLLDSVHQLPNKHLQDFARCAILRTGQWALDGRPTIPSATAFRSRFQHFVDDMLEGMRAYTSAVASHPVAPPQPYLICAAASTLRAHTAVRDHPPALVLTSPPYPGIHVLYHRWQVLGRRETPAPFWIANTFDGHGESHYTFGGRHDPALTTYYDSLRDSFRSIRSVSRPDTIIAQLVGFSNPRTQLRRYLGVLDQLGFQEVLPVLSPPSRPRRLWRRVPNRRWYTTTTNPNLSSAKEVLLLHRLSPHPTR